MTLNPTPSNGRIVYTPHRDPDERFDVPYTLCVVIGLVLSFGTVGCLVLSFMWHDTLMLARGLVCFLVLSLMILAGYVGARFEADTN